MPFISSGSASARPREERTKALMASSSLWANGVNTSATRGGKVTSAAVSRPVHGGAGLATAGEVALAAGQVTFRTGRVITGVSAQVVLTRSSSRARDTASPIIAPQKSSMKTTAPIARTRKVRSCFVA